MKVILKKGVKKIGQKGEIVNVKNGFGRNFLIPQGLAEPATRGAIADLKLHQAKQVKSQGELAQKAEEISAKAEGKVLEIPAKAGEAGQLFGSVGQDEIAAAVSKLVETKIPANSIAIDSDIKKIGDYKVKLKFTPEKSLDLKLKVVPENGN